MAFSASVAMPGRLRETLRRTSIAGKRPRSAMPRSRTTWPSRTPRVMSAIGSSMSEAATSTEKMPVMSPLPNGPGPARSQSAAIRLAVEGGKPRRDGASPAVRAISRWASAKRVSESMSRRTWRPWSRKTSAAAIAIQAARRLISGAWSEVAATTTARAMPSGPSTLSTKSRSSRPRSPISA